MNSCGNQDSDGLPGNYRDKLYRRLVQGALVRSGASLIMWPFSFQISQKQFMRGKNSSAAFRIGQAKGGNKKMWTMKKAVISALVLLACPLVCTEAGAEKRIGILMFSEEARYIAGKEGFLEKLKETGFGEPRTEIIIESGAANKAKTAELVQKFAAAKMDLILSLGTSASTAICQEIKDVAVVFAVVYDPVAAGIAKNWISSGNNTTGSSTKMPMSKLIEAMKQFAPLKRLAVLSKTIRSDY